MGELDRKLTKRRVALALGAGLAYALASYLLVDWMRPDGAVSATFVLVQPVVICAFAAYLGDPLGQRGLSYYLLVPVVLGVGVVVISAFVLQEGAVCIVMLLPVWLLLGEIGSYLTYRLRPDRIEPSRDADTFRVSVLLAIPFIALPIEARLPVPEDRYTVSRSIEIAGSREEIWALMQTIPTLADGEGQWNVTQDLVGVPRPVRAELVGSGIGALRMAEWQHDIAFRERVTQWQEGEAIGWTFEFPPNEGWAFTDRHLRPDAGYMQIESGGYRLQEISPGHFRLTLATRYAARTHFNPYAALWGELFLGDIQDNLLTAIRQRVED